MEATTARRRTVHPMSYYWGVVKDMDDSQKLELITLLAESVKPKITAAPPMKRYTMDDINAMLDEAEADFAVGKGIPDEEVWRKWDEELAREEQEALDDSRLQGKAFIAPSCKSYSHDGTRMSHVRESTLQETGIGAYSKLPGLVSIVLSDLKIAS